MSFGTGREIYLNVGNSISLGGVTLPPGELVIFGARANFRPRGEQKVLGYKIDNYGNTVGYYINNQQVHFETWQIEIEKNKDLKNSNFGKKPLHGMPNLSSREASTPDLID